MVIVKTVNPVKTGPSIAVTSLHLSAQQLFAVGGAVAPAVFDCLLEVLSLLCHDYKSCLVLTERANLLRLAGDVILFEGAVAEALAVENSREEPVQCK